MKFYNFLNKSIIVSSFEKKLKIIVFVLCFCIILSVFVGSIDNILVVEGIIRPKTVTTPIKCLLDGFVCEKYYKNTDFVEEGEILLKIDSSYQIETKNSILNKKKNYEYELAMIKDLYFLLLKTSIENIPYEEEIIHKNVAYSVFVSEYKQYKTDYELMKKNFQRKANLYPKFLSKQELEEAESCFLESLYAFTSWLDNKKKFVHNDYNQAIYNIEECT